MAGKTLIVGNFEEIDRDFIGRHVQRFNTEDVTSLDGVDLSKYSTIIIAKRLREEQNNMLECYDGKVVVLPTTYLYGFDACHPIQQVVAVLLQH